MNGWSEPYRKGYEEGFAKGQNEIVNKSLLDIRRESIQIGREIAEEEHKAMCESCIHKVSAEDIKAIVDNAILEEQQKILYWFLDNDMDKASSAMYGYLVQQNRGYLLHQRLKEHTESE